MKRIIYPMNFLRTIKGILSGKTIATVSSFYDSRYPPTKFLRYHRSKIHIHCIMCGFPRTGTHWISNVIEKSANQKVFRIDYDKPSASDKNVLLIKIHARSKFIARLKALWLLPPHDFSGKYIYVYRDPRDAIISMFEKYKRDKGIKSLDPEKFLKTTDPIGQYRWEINSWVFRDHNNLLLVKFEDLKMNPGKNFEKIFDFLNLDNPVAYDSISQMVGKSDAIKRPRGSAFGWTSAPKEYELIVDTVSKKLAKEIKALGYQNTLL